MPIDYTHFKQQPCKSNDQGLILQNALNSGNCFTLLRTVAGIA